MVTPRIAEPADERVMSRRAQAYLGVAAYRHIAIALAMALMGSTFDSAAFVKLFDIAPRWLWIVTLIAGGVHLGYAAKTQSKNHARMALTISVAVAFMWATAFGIVVLSGVASVFATILFTSFAMKDLIMCAQPMRSPFEDLSALYGVEK